MQTTTTAPSPPKEALRSAKQPTTTTHFPLKIEFVTAKIPAELEGNRNKSSLTKRKNHKKFITNGLSEDSQKSRIITSSENLNVNLDHYADFTRTGITNGENNIVVGTLSGIKDRANAGMINLQVDTAEREQALNITKITGSRPTDRHTVATNKKLFNVKTKPYNIHKTISTNSQSQTSLSNVKKQDKSMTDFSISLLAAHEVEKATQAPLKKTKPTVKAPVKKSPRFVLRNNNNSGKSFVFSFKTNKKPKKNVPKVTSVQFQPAFIYKDTAEIHSLNDIAKKAKDALQRISEVFKGPPDNIIAVSKTDAYKKYKKAATEVIEMKKSPTMVPAVGIIKPLRKSEAIYKFSQYGSKRSQEMTEDNAIKREIKKLLIQQNTIYPGPLQKGPVSYPRVTPMMDQNVYTQNEITSNARGMLYNTPEMTSMMIATESMAPEQNGGYIQNYNFPGANRQALGNSARLPFQNSVRVTPPMPIVQPIVQPKVYQPSGGQGPHHRMSWTTVLPDGSTMDEFAIVKDDEMVIFLVSDQTPPHSTLDKSSTLLDFTVGHMAMRFNIDGTNGQMCFVTHTSAKYQNTKEALQNRALSQVVRLADPIQLYAELTTHVPQHDLHRVGGSAFYKFCKIAIKQDNVYELVMAVIHKIRIVFEEDRIQVLIMDKEIILETDLQTEETRVHRDREMTMQGYQRSK
uniref:Uncharacterized protein n=1 Tax=Magallana gigas TaxID=29159 RepID=K1R4N9_MAGGI